MLKIPDEQRGKFTGVMGAVALAIAVATSSLAGGVGFALGGGGMGPRIQVENFEVPEAPQIEFDGNEGPSQIEDLTQGEVKPVSASQLEDLFPEMIGPYRKVDSESESVGEIASTAQATYRWRNYSFDLSIADLTVLGGAADALLQSGVEFNRNEGNGYEKLGKIGGRMVHEEWDNDDNSGSYGVLVGNRFMVQAEGNTRAVDGLRAGVDAIDEDELAELAR